MDIMQILKIAFAVMLCVPVAYIAYILIEQLLDLLAQSQGVRSAGAKRKTRKERRKRRRR